MSKVYVYSTMTNSIYYGPWLKGGADLPYRPRKVLINGGANMVDPHTRLFVPKGEVTILTQEEFELCQQDPLFNEHRKQGFITATVHDTDPDEVAADMTARSFDAPLTDDIIKAENATKPESMRQSVQTNIPELPAKAKAKARSRRK